MNTSPTTRLAGLLGAILMTVSVNTALLWKFDTAAQQGLVAASPQAPASATLAATATVARSS